MPQSGEEPITDIDAAVNAAGLGFFSYFIALFCGLCFFADAAEVVLLSFLYACLTR